MMAFWRTLYDGDSGRLATLPLDDFAPRVLALGFGRFVLHTSSHGDLMIFVVPAGEAKDGGRRGAATRLGKSEGPAGPHLLLAHPGAPLSVSGMASVAFAEYQIGMRYTHSMPLLAMPDPQATYVSDEH